MHEVHVSELLTHKKRHNRNVVENFLFKQILAEIMRSTVLQDNNINEAYEVKMEMKMSMRK